MRFTYSGYKGLLEKLESHGYHTASYTDWNQYDRCVILRHDIDNDIGHAVEMAAFEAQEEVKSTYFVLLTSDFYNVFSQNTQKGLQKIRDFGHEIGLHFDEVQYGDITGDLDAVREKIQWEANVLGEALGCPIRTVSMHRPGRTTLDSDLQIPGMVNSYGKTYFKEFKYLSDSRRRWREPVEEVIESEQYNRLHILTHAFWYYEEEQTLEQTVNGFVNGANWSRYLSYKDNFTRLSEVMVPEKVQGFKGKIR